MKRGWSPFSVEQRHRPKLLNDLKPGTRIVSNTLDMGWKPDKELTLDDTADDYGLSHKFFLWIVPRRTEK